MEKELDNVGMQENIQIHLAKIKKKISRMPNWKNPGPNGTHGCWINNLSSKDCRIGNQLNQCLQENWIPSRMVTGKTLHCIKEIEKRNVISSFIPITCLSLIGKVLTGVFTKILYRYLENKNLLL